MKIYKCKNGIVYGLEVRETEKRYISMDSGCRLSAFGYAVYFSKTEPTSPEQAIQEERNRLLTSRGMTRDKLDELDKQLVQLEAVEYHISAKRE